MFGNYLSAALGNLIRNKLHAAINLFGLALGLASAILIGLYVRDEVTFEHFLPNYERIYRVGSIEAYRDAKPKLVPGTPHDLAAALRDGFPEFAEVTRMTDTRYGIRSGTAEATETVLSVDPNFLRVIDLKMLGGDPATALAAPESIVLSRAMALKYFGTVDCLGRTIELNRKDSARVSGVFEDLPSNTHLYGVKFLLSGLAPFGVLANLDRQPPQRPGNFVTDVTTYGRLKPGAAPTAVDARLADLMNRNYPQVLPDNPTHSGFLAPISAIHLHGREFGDFSSGSDLPTVYAISATGILVLIVAGINFVNLVTARATRRALEVGVRKAAGATRSQLFTQFMGEAIVYAFLALLLATGLVELTLPSLNGFLDRTITFPYWRDPILLAGLPGVTLAIGLFAGFYPALILSGFRPAETLKGGFAAQGSGTLRQGLVVLQYAISIGLLIATAVIFRQTEFATGDSLRFDKDRIVVLSLGGIPGEPAKDGGRQYQAETVERLRQRLEALPGVKAVADSWITPNAQSSWEINWTLSGAPGAKAIVLDRVVQGFGFFEIYGIRPIVGRSFERDHGEDAALEDAGTEGTVVLNQSAARALGFGTADAAVGRELDMELTEEPGHTQPRRIVGVVPDFPLSTIRTKIPPTAFMIKPSWSNYLNIKLTGENLPATLTAIDRTWQEMVPTRPVQRQFIDDRIERLYRDVARQGQVFAGFAGVAVLIACLGLFGLAAFTAERRTKEIGIRKAMGADTADILKLLVWEFAKPVLLANIVAWPVAYVAMSYWLDGFAYRISLDPAIFIGAGLLALIIACGVTLYHALQMARSRPVLALHYE